METTILQMEQKYYQELFIKNNMILQLKEEVKQLQEKLLEYEKPGEKS
jgi:hypothetical protein